MLRPGVSHDWRHQPPPNMWPSPKARKEQPMYQRLIVLLVLVLAFVGGGVALLDQHPLAGGVLVAFGCLFGLLTAAQAVKQ